MKYASLDSKTLFDLAHSYWDAGKLKSAFFAFKAAAQRGDDFGANSLGYFYDLGLGIRKNSQKALFWYKRAARQGDIIAYTNIGTIYRDQKNISRAKFWFIRALQNGDGDAALELAKLYRAKNTIKTLHYLKLALVSEHITEASQEEAKAMLKILP